MDSRKMLLGLSMLVVWCYVFPSEGHPQWLKTYGDTMGSGHTQARSIREAPEGGYVIGGYAEGYGAGGYDFFAMKVSSSGAAMWQSTFGGSGDDVAHSMDKTYDSKYGHGYILAGETDSFGAGGEDFLVIKLAEDGSLGWKKTLGGSSWDTAYAVQQTSDSGYIVAGRTASSGMGAGDALIVKLYLSGVVQWQRTFGGTLYDEAYAISETTDGGFIVTGKTNSSGSGSYSFDLFVLKISSAGSLQWQKIYGGVHSDEGRAIEQTSDGGYILCGISHTSDSNSDEIIVLKLSSTGTIQWQKSFGETYTFLRDDGAYSLEQTSDGGFLIVGELYFSAEEIVAIKLTGAGALQWIKKIDLPNSIAYSVQQLSTGGYVLTGKMRSDSSVIAQLTSGGDIPGCTYISDYVPEDPFMPISEHPAALSQGTPSLTEGNPTITTATVTVPEITWCGPGAGCGGATVQASTCNASPVYKSSDLLKHLACLLLPVGAVFAIRVWRRRR